MIELPRVKELIQACSQLVADSNLRTEVKVENYAHRSTRIKKDGVSLDGELKWINQLFYEIRFPL